MTKLESTPLRDGFRMPAEFEPHAGCWMLWPYRTDTWRLGGKPAQRAWIEVAAAISRFEPVTVGVPAHQYENARAQLPEHIRVVELSSNDAWMRDSGPTFVVNHAGEVRGVDWEFNAWGGLMKKLYFPWDQDNLIASKVLQIERKARYKAPFVLEGGSIHVDGEGTCITTEECLLNPNRNPDMTKADIEQGLKDYLGVEKVIWLGDGVYLDETDGHVDNLCCFIRPAEVALTWTDDESDPQYAISCAAYEALSAATDARGRRFTIHKIHQPGPLYRSPEEASGVDHVMDAKLRTGDERLAGSYINFYIANGGVIVPTFNDPYDEPALAKIRELFPDREVVGVSAREILLGGGNIHCITQQQPME